MRTDWKKGDECWWFDNLTREIKSGIIIYAYATAPDNVCTAMKVRAHGAPDYKFSPNTTFLTSFDVFPTREALCEHYKKIFEI